MKNLIDFVFEKLNLNKDDIAISKLIDSYRYIVRMPKTGKSLKEFEKQFNFVWMEFMNFLEDLEIVEGKAAFYVASNDADIGRCARYYIDTYVKNLPTDVDTYKPQDSFDYFNWLKSNNYLMKNHENVY